MACFSDVYFKLTSQIKETFSTIDRSASTALVEKLKWCDELQSIVDHVLPGSKLILVGSSINLFGFKSSDCDLTMVSRDSYVSIIACLKKIEAALKPYGKRFDVEVELPKGVRPIYLVVYKVVSRAKVPILKLKDKEVSLEGDINVNKHSNIRHAYLFRCYVRLDPRVQPLGVVIKLWAKKAGILNQRDHKLSGENRKARENPRLSSSAENLQNRLPLRWLSQRQLFTSAYQSNRDPFVFVICFYAGFTLLLLYLYYLQVGCSPPVVPMLQYKFPGPFKQSVPIWTIVDRLKTNEQPEELKHFVSENKQSLGELFVGFFRFYSSFNWNRVISISRPDGYVSNRRTRIQIEDPYELGGNSARGIYEWYGFSEIKQAFSNAYRKMNDGLDLDKLL